MKLRNLIAASALLLAFGQAEAAGLDNLIADVLANNPTLASIARANKASFLSRSADNNLPDPEVEFEHNWAQERGVENKWSAGISQSFEWPGVYGARSKANKASKASMQALLESSRLETALQAKLLAIDYVYACSRRDMLRRVRDNIDSLYLRTLAAFNHGEADILSLKKLKVQTVATAAQLAEMQNAVETADAAITALNGGRPVDLSAITAYPDEPLLPVADYHEIYTNHDPASRSYGLAAEAARLEASAAKMSALPGFTLGYRHASEEGHHFNGIAVGVSLPVFSGRHRKAAAIEQALSLESESEAYNTARMSVLDTDIAAASRMLADVERMGAELDNDNYLELLTKAVDGGQISVITYLLETNSYIDTCMDYLAMRYSFQQAAARLNRYSLLPLTATER